MYIHIYIYIIHIYIYAAVIIQVPNPCSVERRRREGTHAPPLLPVRDPPFATCTHVNK